MIHHGHYHEGGDDTKYKHMRCKPRAPICTGEDDDVSMRLYHSDPGICLRDVKIMSRALCQRNARTVQLQEVKMTTPLIYSRDCIFAHCMVLGLPRICSSHPRGLQGLKGSDGDGSSAHNCEGKPAPRRWLLHAGVPET